MKIVKHLVWILFPCGTCSYTWCELKHSMNNVGTIYCISLPILCSCFFVYPQHSFLQLSLFFDILLCLTTDITKEDYIAGTFKQPHAISSGVISTESQSPGESVMKRARAKLWKNLKEADLKMKAGE